MNQAIVAVGLLLIALSFWPLLRIEGRLEGFDSIGTKLILFIMAVGVWFLEYFLALGVGLSMVEILSPGLVHTEGYAMFVGLWSVFLIIPCGIIYSWFAAWASKRVWLFFVGAVFTAFLASFLSLLLS